jgi:hypothetical protein
MAMVPSCPACGHEHSDVQANDMADTPIAPEERRAGSVTPLFKRPVASSPTLSPAPAEPVDVLGIVRTRIAFLDTELARNAGYLAERKQLARMLAAAEKTKTK